MLYVAIFLIPLILMFIFATVKMIPQYERGVVFRLGKVRAAIQCLSSEDEECTTSWMRNVLGKEGLKKGDNDDEGDSQGGAGSDDDQNNRNEDV